jgi:hypothetical protein
LGTVILAESLLFFSRLLLYFPALRAAYHFWKRRHNGLSKYFINQKYRRGSRSSLLIGSLQ